ncbi:MAG: FHA domain-containing protein [Gammaproteobacteria bacterium]|nr:MAG: FHA domain-containing protein [Gammaproteobacteria bacterium]
MTALIVEVSDFHRRHPVYYRFEELPVSIGRGYDNDVIVSDPHVCARHLIINPAEQGWQVHDLETRNGVVIQHRKNHEAFVSIRSGDELMIGKTRLRFFDPQHPVAATRLLPDSSSFYDVIRSMVMVWGLLCLLVIGFITDTFFASSEELHIERLLANSLPLVAGVLIWSAIWTLLAYIVRRQVYFYYMLLVAVIYILADLLLENALGFLAFNLNNNLLAQVLSYVTGGLLLAALFYASMHRALTVSNRRKLVLANIFSWVIVAVVILVVLANQPAFRRNPEFPAELKPPFSRMMEASSIDAFVTESRNLIQEFEH